MCNPSAAQWPVIIVALVLRRLGMRNQGVKPAGVSSGWPEKFDISPVGVQVRSLVNTRAILTSLSGPVSDGSHCGAGP